MQVGIGLPEAVDGFDAIPAWRHADIHKSQRVGIPRGGGLVHQRQSLLALLFISGLII